MNLDARVVYEGFGHRLLAGFIDLFLLALVAATVMFLGIVAGADAQGEPLITEYGARLLAYGVWWLVAGWAALVPCWAFMGASPGMLLLGSRVVREDNGSRLTLGVSAVRAAGLALGLAALGIGILWCIRAPKHQALHDKLARSVVVREDESLMSLEELVEEFE